MRLFQSDAPARVLLWDLTAIVMTVIAASLKVVAVIVAAAHLHAMAIQGTAPGASLGTFFVARRRDHDVGQEALPAVTAKA